MLYFTAALSRTEREGEIDLSYKTMESDFITPGEWKFVTVGRDRGFYLCKKLSTELFDFFSCWSQF